MRAYYRLHPEKKAAWRKWFKEYRKTNKAYNEKFRKPDIEKMAASRKAKRELINRHKMRPCADCKIQHNPWVMQFDHKPGFQKAFNVSWLYVKNASLELIETEIAKCEVVCANCHAERSYRSNYNKRARSVHG